MREVVVRLVAVAGVQDSEGGICEVLYTLGFSSVGVVRLTALTTIVAYCCISITP